MKKTILIFAIVGLSTLGVNAQTKPRLSIAANLGVPTTSGYSFAYGADLQADFGIASTTFITLSGGYEGYSWKGGGSSGVIPLLAGAKFFFGEANKLYGHAQLGYAFSSKGGGGAFAYAPSLGYYVNPSFDIALKYLASSKDEVTVGSLNVRFAYNF